MLGEAFREEVAANGGRLPSFSLATIADVASRVWLKARAWKGGKQAHQPQVCAAQLVLLKIVLQAALPEGSARIAEALPQGHNGVCCMSIHFSTNNSSLFQVDDSHLLDLRLSVRLFI